MPKPATDFEEFMDLIQQSSPEFRAWWSLWLEHRRQKRKHVTKIAAKLQLEKLSRFSVPAQIEAIKTSIECDYQGLFPKEEQYGSLPRAYKPQQAPQVVSRFRED